MAMGKAVVSTTVGAEGLPVVNGEHVLLADEPNTFARAVVRLLRDANRRTALATAARTLVVERYDWSAVAGSLEGALYAFADRGVRTSTSPARPALEGQTADSPIAPIASQSAIRNPQSAL
jgi:hypothetical protein